MTHISSSDETKNSQSLQEGAPDCGNLGGRSITYCSSDRVSTGEGKGFFSRIAQLIARIIRFIKRFFGFLPPASLENSLPPAEPCHGALVPLVRQSRESFAHVRPLNPRIEPLDPYFGEEVKGALGDRSVVAYPRSEPLEPYFGEEVKGALGDRSIMPFGSHSLQNRSGSRVRIDQRVEYRYRGQRVVVDLNGEMFARLIFDPNTGKNHRCLGFEGDINGEFSRAILDSELTSQLLETFPPARQIQYSQEPLNHESISLNHYIRDDYAINPQRSAAASELPPLLRAVELGAEEEIAEQELAWREYLEVTARKEAEFDEVLAVFFEEAAAREERAVKSLIEPEDYWILVGSVPPTCESLAEGQRFFKRLRDRYGEILSHHVIASDGLDKQEVLGEAHTRQAVEKLECLKEVIGENKNLAAYLFHSRPADESKNDIDDLSPIRFEKGQIIPDQELTDQGKKITKEVFVCLLNAGYGSELGYRVVARYDLMKKEALTLRDIHKVLVGIAANVRVEDLKKLFNEIKSNGSEKFECRKFLKEKDECAYEEVREVNSFETLTSEQMGFLLSAFRTVPSGSKGEVAHPTVNIPFKEDVFRDVLFKHDHELLVKFEQWDQLLLEGEDRIDQQELHELAVSEHVGKNVCYRNLENGMVFAIPDRENRAQFYRVQDHFRSNGVMPSLVVPITENSYEEELKLEETHNIHLAFRGTSSLVQWFRNTDYSGVGAQEFAKQQERIIGMVSEYLFQTECENVVLHISGHSLGGCDTQRALTLIMEEIAKSREDSPLRKIRRVVVKTHNAPRPEPALNERLKIAMKKIFDNREAFNVEVDLTHIRYFDQQYQDVVSTLGEVLVGADQDGEQSVFSDARSIFRRQLLDIQIEENLGYAGGLRSRHGFKAFNRELSKGRDWSIKARHRSNDENVSQMEREFAGSYHRTPEDQRRFITLLFCAIYSTTESIARFNTNMALGTIVKSGQLAGIIA